MKLVKMSLAAAVLLSASAFAIDNVKVSGDAKLYYSTNNDDAVNTPKDGLFGQANSAADTALRLAVTGDLTKNVSFGATGYAVSSLGLENNLVSNVWAGARNGVQDNAWMGELWMATTVGKTTAKAGRMELDTPFVFSEKWSIVPNTFAGAVLINQDLSDTTLVAAWVGQGNGLNAVSGVKPALANGNSAGLDNMGKDFGTFISRGAYAVGAINNSLKPLVAQAWYYNVMDVADAFWLQADWDCQLVKDVKVGVQYANIDPKGMLSTSQDSNAYAVKVAYAGVKNLNVSAAYSKVDKKGLLDIANVATNNMGSAESKLYTEAFWNRGYVGEQDATAWNAKASYDVKEVAKFFVSCTNVNNGNTTQQSNTSDLTEVAMTASKSFGSLDVKLAYISTDADALNGGKRFDTVQAYVTLNF